MKFIDLFTMQKIFFNKPLTPCGQDAEAQNVDETVEVHDSDDDNANVDDSGHVNVGEDAYAMPPPLLLQFIPYSHSRSLQLDTLILISLIYSRQ
jgi:hypothetical protein